MLDRGLVGLPIHPGDVPSVPAGKFGVDEAVQGGDLAGGVPRDAGANVRGLQDRDGVAGTFKGQRRSQAGDPSANDGHVDLQVGVQGGIADGTGRGDPERNLSSFEPFTHGAAFR